MDLRELLGYALLLLALSIVIAGVWAARHYSHRRVYARRVARERRERLATSSAESHAIADTAAEGSTLESASPDESNRPGPVGRPHPNDEWHGPPAPPFRKASTVDHKAGSVH